MAFDLRPRHRVDGTPEYVDPLDPTAWDTSTIDEELAAMKRRNEEAKAKAEAAGEDLPAEALESAQDHPVYRYQSGKTRYQLDAPVRWNGADRTAREYLLPSAFIWQMRILDWKQWNEVQPLVGSRNASSTRDGYLRACRYGVSGLAGPKAPELEGAEQGFLSHEDMSLLHEMHPGLPTRLGIAVWLASAPLTPVEKKIT